MKHNREDESSEENSEKTKKKAKKQSPLCEAIQSGNQAQIEASLAALQNLYKPIQIMV